MIWTWIKLTPAILPAVGLVIDVRRDVLRRGWAKRLSGEPLRWSVLLFRLGLLGLIILPLMTWLEDQKILSASWVHPILAIEGTGTVVCFAVVLVLLLGHMFIPS